MCHVKQFNNLHLVTLWLQQQVVLVWDLDLVLGTSIHHPVHLYWLLLVVLLLIPIDLCHKLKIKRLFLRRKRYTFLFKLKERLIGIKDIIYNDQMFTVSFGLSILNVVEFHFIWFHLFWCISVFVVKGKKMFLFICLNF